MFHAKRKGSLLALLFTLGAVPIAYAQGQGGIVESPLMVVNGRAVVLADLEAELSERLMLGASDNTALRNEIRRDLVIRTVLLEQAEKEQLDADPAVQKRLKVARDALLVQAWQQRWLLANPPTEEEVQAEYQQAALRAGNREYQLRQVVVRDETSARLVLEQVRAGKSLSELAKAYSIEPMGRDEGGVLPWVVPSLLVSPLDVLVPKAKLGQVHPDPVRSVSGWHVFEVLAQRPFTMPSLDQARAQVAKAVAQRKLNLRVQQLVNAARIDVK